MPNNPDFPTWLEEKYLDWQMQRGARETMAAFANWLGISPPLLSHYMNGFRRPSVETTQLLADKLGDEIYDFLGFRRPDPELQKFILQWTLLTPKERAELSLQLQAMLDKRDAFGDGDDD